MLLVLCAVYCVPASTKTRRTIFFTQRTPRSYHRKEYAAPPRTLREIIAVAVYRHQQKLYERSFFLRREMPRSHHREEYAATLHRRERCEKSFFADVVVLPQFFSIYRQSCCPEFFFLKPDFKAFFYCRETLNSSIQTIRRNIPVQFAGLLFS